MFVERQPKKPQTIQLNALPLFHWFRNEDNDVCIWMNDTLYLSEKNCLNLTTNRIDYSDPYKEVTPLQMFGTPQPLSKKASDYLVEQTQN